MSNFKLAFIYPDLGWNSVNFSPAILVLSAYISKHMDAHVKLFHLNDVQGMKYDVEALYAALKEYNPDLIGFTCTSYNYSYVEEIASSLRTRNLGVPMVLGGSHAMINPTDIMKSSLDAFCVGEGELCLLELCRKIQKKEDFTSVPGFIFKTPDGVATTQPGEVLVDLDDIPERNYELFDTRAILKARNGWLNIGFSRGCPFRCSFCVNQTLKDIFKRSKGREYFRCQSVKRVIGELEHLVDFYKDDLKVINFDDDLLLLRQPWFLDFAKTYKERIFDPHGIRYVINARANLIDEKISAALKESGCFEVQLGFETGDESQRNLLLRKDITNKCLEDAFSMLRENKLRTLAYAMIAIPGETHETISKTIEMLNILKPTLIRMTVFDPFYGTPLYDYCLESHLFKDVKSGISNHFSGSNLVFKDLTDKDISLYHLFFPWHLNAGRGGVVGDRYAGLIREYRDLYDVLPQEEIRERVIKADREASGEFAGSYDHFRYFRGNTFYFEYCEKNTPC